MPKKPDRDYISFSAFKTYSECPRAYKLKYIDKVVPYESNIFLAFGSALHSTLEEKIKNKELDEVEHFTKAFRRELSEIPEKFRKEKYTPETMMEFKEQGIKLVKQFLSAFDEQFEDGYDLISCEEKMFEPMSDTELKFYGFIDLVIRDKKTGKIHIIDHKSCGWGWLPRKKSDKLMIYQQKLENQNEFYLCQNCS